MSVQISEHESDLGWWRTWRRRPPAPLHPFLRNITASQSVLPRALGERHMPSLSVALVVNFGAPHRLGDRQSGGAPGLDAWVVGLQTVQRRGEALGEREFMVAQLTPIGAHLILGRLPMERIVDRITPLAEIDPHFAARLGDRISRAVGWPDRFEAVEAAIADRLAEAAPPRLAAQALGRLVSTDGATSLSRLAGELGCSHRQMIELFRHVVGVTPKRAARLVRFGRALAEIDRASHASRPDGRPYLELEPNGARAGSGISWASLAADCGYYDQPHFINEFRAFTGSSPREFLSRAVAEAPA
jgi:AraC-like DNA-binding protein